MTYVPVILACEQRGVWGEHGLVRVALCFTIIRAWLKWAHEGVILIFTIEMNSFGQLHWDCIKCVDTSFPHVPWIPYMPSVIIKPYINSKPKILCMWKKNPPNDCIYHASFILTRLGWTLTQQYSTYSLELADLHTHTAHKDCCHQCDWMIRTGFLCSRMLWLCCCQTKLWGSRSMQSRCEPGCPPFQANQID